MSNQLGRCEVSKEKYYDDVIAPALSKLAKDALGHGLSFLAIVEWEKDETGRTHYTVEGTQGMSFRMANWAAQCRGNIDSFLLAAMKYAAKYGHNSVFLKQQGIPLSPVAQVETGEGGAK